MFLLKIWQEDLILFSIFIKWSFWLVTKRLHCFSLNIRLHKTCILCSVQFSSVWSLSCVQFFATPWTAACQDSLSITNSQSILKLMSIESVMSSNHLILCHPLLLLLSIFPNESVLHIMWSKYWSFSFSIGPSNKYSGLISFRMDWLTLLAVQGTHISLFQHHSAKASILQCSAFLIVQLSHPHLTTGKP